MNERLEATVRGRVQGVGFRAFAVAQAERLGIVGQVWNGADGRTVEVVAEGPRPALERFVQLLRQGPAAANVDDVVAVWLPATATFDAFSITRR